MYEDPTILLWDGRTMYLPNPKRRICSVPVRKRRDRGCADMVRFGLDIV